MSSWCWPATGVWDTISNEELCAFIHNRLRVCTDLRDVCTQVIDLCLYKGSLDNISIIVLCFPGAPQLSAEALHQEAELEDLLESKVAEKNRRRGVFARRPEGQVNRTKGQGAGRKHIRQHVTSQGLNRKLIIDISQLASLHCPQCVFRRSRDRTSTG
ncbi:Protein phosphatase 1A [Larimichthys crocea]|uniref:Uncharacterized protein n=1 Tax=Larimichthys crocea TaxID=215358 RepID=A0ACD3R3C9_LARCR|nr:Protein phosphatase 1A [Larimichthys crocea]